MALGQELDISDVPSIEQLRQGAQICAPLFNRLLGVTKEKINDTVRTLMSDIPVFQDASPQWFGLLEHLLFRYAILCSERSRVQIMRVAFGSTVGLGLKSRGRIEAGIVLFETCSSMSSDSVAVGGPSIIERKSSQTGPPGPCAILGPFRLINHDCDPNCHVCSASVLDALMQINIICRQILPIPQTTACTVTTIRNIEPDEEITVQYSPSGYYRENCCACKTCTGKDSRDLTVLRAEAAKNRAELASEQGGTGGPSGPKKRARRGGAKRTRQKQQRAAVTQEQGEDTGDLSSDE
ncbi:hypothetical protein FA95DRAFT_1559562 [Auriscalpium vulgare]|uniref:Uncharacterized protein n=1 Tax=Auriscalpium vulgare TaxID=40419 RepID=A0ACB8RRU0_9AGAM|nr:hypothetical protein FA95DRAFT_1559562 [Auriscalpium vulgare]